MDQPGGRSLVLALLCAGLVLLTASCAAVSQPPGASVVSVGDGDSIQVRQAGQLLRVRLACIDAPEQGQRPHGQQAHRELRQQLPSGSTVVLAVKATDSYGRTVAEVYHQHSNINLAMVEAGEAFAYPRHLHQCNGQAYRDAEQRARQRGDGIWQQPQGIQRPWQFRASSRGAPLRGSEPLELGRLPGVHPGLRGLALNVNAD
jgi:endonuclease YncB( thermonuclease family)